MVVLCVVIGSPAFSMVRGGRGLRFSSIHVLTVCAPPTPTVAARSLNLDDGVLSPDIFL